MGNFKVYTTFNKSSSQTAPSACKTQFWGPLTNWKFEPTPSPHTHSDPIINKHTERVKKLCMDLSWHALNSDTGQNSLSHWKQGFGNPWFSKPKFQTHAIKPTETEPSLRKVSLPLQNYVCFSPLTSGLESFGHKSTPSDNPWIEVYCPKF